MLSRAESSDLTDTVELENLDSRHVWNIKTRVHIFITIVEKMWEISFSSV